MIKIIIIIIIIVLKYGVVFLLHPPPSNSFPKFIRKTNKQAKTILKNQTKMLLSVNVGRNGK